jgi:hypothetical protein
MTTKAINPHGEAALDVDAYECIGWFDNAPDYPMGPEFREALQRQRQQLLDRGSSKWSNLSQCAHCGTHIRYHVVMRDTRDDSLIAVGETCADDRFGLSKSQWKAKKDKLDQMRAEARTGQKWIKLRQTYPEAVALLEENLDQMAEWDAERDALYADARANGTYTNTPEFEDAFYAIDKKWRALRKDQWPDFVSDIARRMKAHRKLSQRQAEAALEWTAKHRQKVADRAAKRAEQDAEPKAPVVTGNGVTIEGVVLATKIQDSDYGSTLKMLVKVDGDDGSYKVWGTVPSAMPTQHTEPTENGMACFDLRNSTVRFVANVDVSNDDESFGFFKRPRKAEVLSWASMGDE